MEVALDSGADYVGLVFFPPSPRNLSLGHAAKLAEMARPRSQVVALSVDPEDELIDAIAGEIAPDIFQLHGNETPARAREIQARTGADVLKAIKVETAEDAELALQYADDTGADSSGLHILFDARAPEGAKLPGGNGLPFDWRALDDIRGRMPFMLSGGLDPYNVAGAIRLTGAAAVDVSSGVESELGVKDPELIRAFLLAAKAV